MSLTVDALAGLVPAFRILEETDSTNRVAAAWAEEGADEWSVVAADHQTAGRGRLDRTWFAPKGEALLFSVIVLPSGDPALVSLAAAVALVDVIRDGGPTADLKWPNDVLIGSKKVAGILSELRPGLRGDVVIVGIGLNVNVADFPPDLHESATSLLLETGVPVDRGMLLRQFIASFKKWSGAPVEEMLSVYRTYCVTIGRRVKVQMPGGLIEAQATDVDPAGGLVLDDGSVVRAGDIIHLR